MTPTSPGWYDDPHQADQLRYFDGIVWTAHVEPRRTREATPPPQDVSAPPPPTADPYGWRSPSPPPRSPGQQWNAPQWQQPQWQQATGPVAGPRTVDGVPLASYWQRVGASVIDTLIAGLISSVLGGWLLWKSIAPWFQQVLDAAEKHDQTALDNLNANVYDYLSGGYFVAFVVVTVVVQLGYHLFFLTRSGATPGKKATGISVRLVDRPGALSLDSAVKRQVIAFGAALLGMVPGGVSLLGTLVTLADVLLPLWDPKRQALHDKLARTQVVRGAQPPRQRT